MSNGADLVADSLMDSLLTEEVFNLPTVDLNDPAFEFPSIVGNPLYAQVSELTNEDLTTRTVGGAGTYDAIMQSQANHLKDEFSAGRITGAEYTKAYIALAQSAGGQAIQFLLGKDQAYWSSVNAQGQALIAKVQLETAKAQLAIALAEMKNQRATFALNKIRLANEDAQYGITKYNLDSILPAQLAMSQAQKSGQDKANETATYNLSTVLPAQTAQITTQTSQVTQQTANMVIEGTNLGKQGLMLDVQKTAAEKTNLISDYNLATVLPAQVSVTNAQKSMIVAQTALETSNNSIASYKLATLMPNENDILLAQKAMITAQKSGVEQANLIASYNLASLLPAQLLLVKEQTEVQRAQTLDSRYDGAAVAGSVKSQKDLYAQQVISYKRSSEVNAAKIFTDAWVADSAIQDSPIVPTAFSSANISSVLSSIKSLNGL